MEPGVRSTTSDFAAMMRAAHLILDGEPKIHSDTLAIPLAGFSRAADLREAVLAMGGKLAPKIPGASPETVLDGVRAGIVVRARIAEECLLRAIERGVKQYVVLGAGLDSSAYRLPDTADHVRVFEVDYPATQSWKRAQLAKLSGICTEHVTFVPIDFERETLLARLEAYGFDRSKPAFISWLGVVWYLGERAFIDVLHEVATLAAGSELVFEYPIPMHLVDPEDRPLVQLVRQIGASRGEPMLCAGYDPAALVMRVEALGFTKVLDLSPRDIQVLYFMGREDRLRMPGIGHFMAAQR